MKMSSKELESLFLRKIPMLKAMGMSDDEAKVEVKKAMLSAIKLMNR
jgi:hypothetical protein